MLLAVAARERAACLGRHVGAVLVTDQRIIATGYNGTPTGFANCDEGGCHRCAHPDDYARGRGYDVCICVHAEQNAVLQAARLGYTVQSARCYTTLRPCFGCLKELYQAGVSGVRYLNEWCRQTRSRPRVRRPDRRDAPRRRGRAAAPPPELLDLRPAADSVV